MVNVLMVAEKPSLAHSIAEILSNRSMSTRPAKTGGPCKVHEYKGQYKGKPANFKVTSVCGHVFSIDFEAQFNNWDKTDPAELFSAGTLKEEANPKMHMRKHLKTESASCDELVLWLDCDREGENICFEVMSCIPHIRGNSVRRAHFSAITDKDIKKAMNNLGSPNKLESLAVDARQELDLRIGCAFTRFQTKFFQGQYGDLDSNCISYGPCQTPTLGFCVERHDQITKFKPEKFWRMSLAVQTESSGNLYAEWQRGRIFDQGVANMLHGKIKNTKSAAVQSVSKKAKAKQRPVALNTVELLRVCSAKLGIGPAQAMVSAERLYTQGYISYPRTETTSYSENFDFRPVISMLQHSGPHSAAAQELMKSSPNPRKGDDKGDHPPITPQRNCSESEVGGEAYRVYNYVASHFLASLMKDYKYEQTEITVKVGNEVFHLTANREKEKGFALALTNVGVEESVLPDVQKGSSLNVTSCQLEEKYTGPPDYLTESDLITLMEKHGIGTDASIPVHINNIVQRNYVQLVSGRKLEPTELGVVLVHGYKKIDPDLVKPQMRASVEKQLDLIAGGKTEFKTMVDYVLNIMLRKFHYFVDHINMMDSLMETKFTSLSSAGKPFSKCGKCNRFMKLIEAKPVRLYCPTCSDTYSLPSGLHIKLYQEKKCPLDDFELLLAASGGASSTGFAICPYCYNNPPFPGMPDPAPCSSCLHPSCSQSLRRTGVTACSECDDGVIYLDPSSKPKWRLSCNNINCKVVVKIFEGAHKVDVLDEACKTCETKILFCEFKAGKEPKALEGASTHKGCIFCDAIFSKLVSVRSATRARTAAQAGRSRRGRGRGGSRGGARGGGRGKPPRDKMSNLANYFV